MSVEICQFCGIEIQFRYIQGKLVPLHSRGSTCVGKRLYRDDERDVCHLTKCPQCGADVYFIRHNGGCAWFNDLGKPWDKHGCFADTSRTPAGWEEYVRKGWSLRYLWIVGPMLDGTGGVFVVCRNKPNRRASYQYVIQMEIKRDGYDREYYFALDGKTVLLSADGTQIITPDSVVWRVSEHIPTYRKSHHEIERNP